MNTFSIIIPTYHLLNDRNKIYFDKLIQSISKNLQSPYTNKRFREIVVVNDYPEEDIEEFVHSIFAKYAIPRSIIHNNQTNKGQGCSRNIGADISSGNYLHFIDQDDYISSFFYSTLLRAIEIDNAQIAFSGLNLHNTNNDKLFSPFRGKTIGLYANAKYLADLKIFLLSNIAVSPGQYIISKNIFNKIGGYADLQNKGTDDWGIFYSLYLQYPQIIITFRHDAVFTYRIHNAQNRKSLDMKASLSEMFCKINHKKTKWHNLLYFFKTNPAGRVLNKIIYRFYWRVPNF